MTGSESHTRPFLTVLGGQPALVGERWLASSPETWGPVVEDHRRLWSHRVVELIAGHVGVDPTDVAKKLLSVKARHRYLLLGTRARTRRCTVFAAIDQLLARAVALKVHHETDDELTWRLVAEVRAEPRRRPTLGELLAQLGALRSMGALGRWIWPLRRDAHFERSHDER